MSSYVQLCQYNQARMGLVIYNPGPDTLYVSMTAGDVSGTPPFGKCIKPQEEWRLPWIEIGELCWQCWYANCSFSNPIVWEWFSTPQLGDPAYSPFKPPSEYVNQSALSYAAPSKRRCIKITATHRMHVSRMLERVKHGKAI